MNIIDLTTSTNQLLHTIASKHTNVRWMITSVDNPIFNELSFREAVKIFGTGIGKHTVSVMKVPGGAFGIPQNMWLAVFSEKKATKKTTAPEINHNTEYHVTCELSCGGYRHGNVEFSGTVEQVMTLIGSAIDGFFDLVSASYEKHGDLRGFCPEFGNGYPTDYPEDAVSITLLDVMDENKKDIPYRHPIYQKIMNATRVYGNDQ